MYCSSMLKKEILATAGLNWRLKDHVLQFTAVEWLIPLQKMYATVGGEKRGLELDIQLNQKEKAANAASVTFMRERRDLNPRPFP